MKRILLLILLTCQICKMQAQVKCDKDFYQLGNCKVDSIDICISSFSHGYEVSFHVKPHQMKCYMEGFSSEQKQEYKFGADSMAVYSLLKEYFIERSRKFYTQRRKADEVESEEDDMVSISVYIKNNLFRYWIYIDTDTYTNHEVQVADELFTYSEEFKKFINLWKERTARTLGGRVLERHNSSVEFWKQYK